jgi:hypothetical protein
MRITAISLFTRVAAEPPEAPEPARPDTASAPAWSPPGGLVARCAGDGLLPAAPQQAVLQALALQGAALNALPLPARASIRATSPGSGAARNATSAKHSKSRAGKGAGKRKKKR